MAEKSLRSISTSYPILSCHELLEYRKKLDQTLPKTGMEKGYLPDENSSQERCLPFMVEDRLDSLKEQRAARNRDLVRAEWNPAKKRAYITKWKGKTMQNTGEIINGKIVLYPEEVLFLMEMSLLELHFNGAIQSIQEAYRLLLGEETSLEKFQVYSHLRRIGYIVVRHKERWDDFSASGTETQEQSVHDKDSKDKCSEQQSSTESEKHGSENEYYNYVSKKDVDMRNFIKKDIDMRRKDSIKIKSGSKSALHVKCLWEGIDIPNIAGTKFIELKVPSSLLLPKNVCPQKQHYVIDVDASKNEVEEYYNEYNADSNYTRTEFFENQTRTDFQTPSGYAGYSTSSNCYNSNDYQFQNISQDDHHCSETLVKSEQPIMPSTSHESTKLHQFPENTETWEESNNPRHMQQHYVNNVHNHFNSTQTSCETLYNQADSSKFESHNFNHSHTLGQSKVPPSNDGNVDTFYSYGQTQEQEYHQHEHSYDVSRNYTENCPTISSSDRTYQHSCHSKLESDQFQNTNQNYYHSTYTGEQCHNMLAQNNENLDIRPSAIESRENLNYNSSTLCEKSHEANRCSRQDAKDSSNLNRRSYSKPHKESTYNEEFSKNRTYKQEYSGKRKQHVDRKYTGRSMEKQYKRKRNTSPVNSSPFPRVSKSVKCWKEFKHEAELQSTAEYLMNGPAKILWNNNVVPLVAPSEHLTKDNVFGALSIIKNVDKSDSCVSQPSYSKLDFDVYLPTTNYSHYDPDPPNHTIKVVRCRDPTPSLEYRGEIPVHYAVVDNGTVTFFSFSNIRLPSYV